MSRRVDPVPHFESVSRVIAENAVLTSGGQGKLDLSEMPSPVEKGKSYIDGVFERTCARWFRRTDVPTRSSAPQVPIASTRL